jgi:hypothetical protein
MNSRAIRRASAGSSSSSTACSAANSGPEPSTDRAVAVASGVPLYSSAPADRSAASSSMRGPSAASTSGGTSGTGGPCQGAASMASR